MRSDVSYPEFFEQLDATGDTVARLADALAG